MKVLVFAHRLEVGGTQVNAIELCAALRDLHGFEVVLFATPGPMLGLAEEKKLRFVPAPDARIHPSPARIQALRLAVRRERPDLLHVWDWWQCLEAYYGVHLPMRVPMVVTDMMMSVTRILPKAVPTTFGTPEIVGRARAAGRRRVELLLPPVDVRHNAPGIVDGRQFRREFGIDDGDIALVTVSRLANWMKSESLIRSVEAVGALGRELPLKCVIVGDGVARGKLAQLAEETNQSLGRRAVVLTGMLVDPRPAYAAADIVVGMGGSALRAMAFAKPVLIVGERGFSAPFTPQTADFFYHKGMYGCGDGCPDNARLVADIGALAARPEQFAALGEFARRFVVEKFSIEQVSARLAAFCRSAANDVPPLRSVLIDGLRTAAVYLRERSYSVPSRDVTPAAVPAPGAAEATAAAKATPAVGAGAPERVSILIPAYNAERFLAQTLQSALAQTWPNKEIIVVDDGSTDGTLRVARQFESALVKVISQPNRGASAARNTALRQAQGDYVQWLDADDLLAADKISRQLAGRGAGRSARELLTCSWGRFLISPGRARCEPGSLWQDLSPVDWIANKFTDNTFMVPCTWLVSRRLSELAGPWNEELSLDDDGEYMCRLVAASEAVRFVADAKCYYRVGNVGSLSWQRSDRALQSLLTSLGLCIGHLLALEDSERTRQACLKYLQDNLPFFYPEKVEFVNQCQAFARALGGELSPPAERVHFRVFRRIFGWRTAKQLRGKLGHAKLLARKTIDSLVINSSMQG